jgi:hypothetical protein
VGEGQEKDLEKGEIQVQTSIHKADFNCLCALLSFKISPVQKYLQGESVGRALAFIIAAQWLFYGCDAGKSIDEVAREVLWVRLIGFIIVLAIAFLFVFRNLRRK